MRILKGENQRIDAFEVWAYRLILLLTWSSRRTNELVLDIRTKRVLREKMVPTKLRYFKHIMRRSGFDKDILLGTLSAQAAPGMANHVDWNDSDFGYKGSVRPEVKVGGKW